MKPLINLSPKEFVKYGLIVFLTMVTTSIGSCSKDKEESAEDVLGIFNTKTIQHEGVERTFHVYLPGNFDKNNATPMVLALHGGGGTGKHFERDVSAGTLTAAAEVRGMIIVTPEGIDKRWNSGRPEIFNGKRSYDDVGFLSGIIDTMIQDYGIDANRVYATGISNGGFMSYRLAFDLSNKIVAIAPVTAQVPDVHANKVPEFPISIMLINGTEDPLVPYNGGQVTVPVLGTQVNRGEVFSSQESIDMFRSFNQCTSESETELLPDNVTADGTQIEIEKYTTCEIGSEVILIKVIGGGHTWPSGAQYLPVEKVGALSEEINASEMILDFFLRHSRN